MYHKSPFTIGSSLLVLLCASGVTQAGVIFGNVGLAQGDRWDAAPRMIGGLERSLDGGLRYSLQGGSFQAYRDSFSWNGPVPTVAAFQQAVEQAFAAWTSVDPVSGFGTSITFAADLGTAVNLAVIAGVHQGAEIDLFASNLGDAGLRAFVNFGQVAGPVTLTSGVAGYNARAISGADLTINSNPGAQYTLDQFRRLLTHELGHTLGLLDIEGTINPGQFIDDNFDPLNPLATMTNTWAALVNPLNPAASAGLALYAIGNASTTPMVDILMESNGLGIGPTNPLGNLVPLVNDDYGTRQFLYPERFVVPEPASLVLGIMGLAGAAGYGWRRRKPSAA